MVAKTFDMSQPTTTTERIEPRSDMFSQSSALYSRINKRKSTSPWMIIAPVAVVVLVGGALLASTGSHQAVLVKAKPAPTSSKTSMSATTASAPVANAGAPIAQPVKAAAAPAKAEARNIVAKRAESTRISTNSTPAFAPRPASNGATSAPSAYDGAKAAVPVATAQAAPVAPAQTVTATPDTVTPAPVPTHATPAPTPDTSATPPASAGQTPPQLTTTPPQA
jgi:hypothetical protein